MSDFPIVIIVKAELAPQVFCRIMRWQNLNLVHSELDVFCSGLFTAERVGKIFFLALASDCLKNGLQGGQAGFRSQRRGAANSFPQAWKDR